MKIAITGGAGFIGAALTQAYLDAGHDVLVIDNLFCGSKRMIDPRARFYEVDIRHRDLATILQDEQPDIVSHHAIQQAYNIPGELSLIDADVHVRGLLNLLDSCVAANVKKLIFASSGNALYGPLQPGHPPFTEESPTYPQQPHDISNIAGECYVRYYTQHYGLTHSILRYADIYGEPVQMQLNHLHHPLSYFIRMLNEGRRPIIHSASEEIRDQLFISDVITANLCALTRGTNQTLHISSGQGTTLKELFQVAAFLLNSDLEPVYLSGALDAGCSSLLHNGKAQQVLGWQPRITLLEGVSHAISLLGISPAIEEKEQEELFTRTVRQQEGVLLRA